MQSTSLRKSAKPDGDQYRTRLCSNQKSLRLARGITRTTRFLFGPLGIMEVLAWMMDLKETLSFYVNTSIMEMFWTFSFWTKTELSRHHQLEQSPSSATTKTVRLYHFLSAGQEHIVTLVTTLPVLALCAAVLRSSQLVRMEGSSSSEPTRKE